MKKILSITTIFLFWFCSQAICFPKQPERIVSLAPTHTEILFALGLEDKIVGVSNYCNYPPAAGGKEKIGGFANPDIDKIISLKADLILAFGTIQKPVAEALKKRGQKVFWIYPRTVEETLDCIERIGEITGRNAQARHLRQRMEKEIEDIQEKLGTLSESQRPAIFRVMGLNPPGTIGANSFQSDVFYLAGGKNVFADIRKDFFQIDNETLLKRNPEIIIICGKNSEKAKERIKEHRAWGNLTAVKRDKIFVISCDLICRPGPRLVETIEKIAYYLHPDKFSVYPQRIISLGPAITEELYLLGAGNRIVGVSTYCHKPQDVRNKERVGTVVNADLEKIISLKSDLVVATSLMNAEEIQKLKNLGVKIVKLAPAPAENFNQICEQFSELGKLVGKEKKAGEIIHRAKMEADVIRKKVKDLSKPRVFVQLGARPLFAATQDSFINDFIKFAGGINIAEKAKTGIYSREEVLKKNPEAIIIVTMGIAGGQEKKIWEKYKVLKAVQDERIYIIDSDKLCSPTPVSFVEVLREIVEVLHPYLVD